MSPPGAGARAATAAARESERRATVAPPPELFLAQRTDRLPERDWARRFAALSLRIRARFSRASAVRRGAELFLRPSRRPLDGRGSEALASARREWLPFAGRHFPFWVWEGASYRPPTVLLIHDWGGRAADLAAFVTPLRREGARVVAFDAPAHGEASGHQSDIVEFAATVAAMLRRHAEWAPPRGVVAHGFGALAATLAVATGAPAERLVFLAAAESFDPLLDRFRRETGMGEGLLEEIRVIVEQRIGRTLESLRGGRVAGALDRPLLAIHDADDSEVSWEHSRRLVDRWRRSRLLRTFGLGHRGLLDREDVLAAAVEHLLAEPLVLSPRARFSGTSADTSS